MRELLYLTAEQLDRIRPYFPLSHGIARVDDRKVISGIIYVIKNGLMWKDAPADYGPYKTLYNRFIRWSNLGVFSKIFSELATSAKHDQRLMIDATHLKAHRTAASLLKKRAFPRCIGRTRGGLNSKLHAVCDGQPVAMFLTAGQVSDYQRGAELLEDLPEAKELLADRGYDAKWFREALQTKGITPCIPPRRNRKEQITYDINPATDEVDSRTAKSSDFGLWRNRECDLFSCRSNKNLYKQRHKIEIMFGRLKDWRRIAMRYDRCAHTFFSAICIAASIIFYLI